MSIFVRDLFDKHSKKMNWFACHWGWANNQYMVTTVCISVIKCILCIADSRSFSFVTTARIRQSQNPTNELYIDLLLKKATKKKHVIFWWKSVKYQNNGAKTAEKTIMIYFIAKKMYTFYFLWGNPVHLTSIRHFKPHIMKGESGNFLYFQKINKWKDPIKTVFILQNNHCLCCRTLEEFVPLCQRALL